MARVCRSIAWLVVTLTLAACAGQSEGIPMLTVAEIWEDPPAYGNQIVCVKGQADFMHSMTLAACDPPSCDCNRSGGHLSLLNEAGRRDRAIWVATTETGLLCEGNECEMICRPFDPRSADALELVGRLRVQRVDGSSYHLILDDLDLEASRQLVAGQWKPISTETVTITLREP